METWTGRKSRFMSFTSLKVVSITTAVTPDMLANVRDGLDYHMDVCRVSRGGHIEHNHVF